MASVWIRTRPTKNGKRYRVEYRLGGRESKIHYGGSFRTLREATARRNHIGGELAALRMPRLALLEAEPARLPTLLEASEAWRSSRVDVEAQTANMHRSAFVRIFKVKPELRTRRVDEISVDDVTVL